MAQKTFSLIKQWALPAILVLTGLLWLGRAWIAHGIEQPLEEKAPVAALSSSPISRNSMATMDSPVFEYDPGWTVGPKGADPGEPADPWGEPSGVFEFDYTGSELALELAVGDYWGYIYITVDGEPANLLPTIAGNLNSQGQLAGYKTFYEPEKALGGAPVSRWVRVHQAREPSSDTVHKARVEVWRSWGQTPIRGVAVNALPAPMHPVWPGVLLLLLGGGMIVGRWTMDDGRFGFIRRPLSIVHRLVTSFAPLSVAIALPLIVLAVFFNIWWLCLLGLALLAVASITRPVLWIAALLFALPFYYSITLPILPGRAMSLIDVGVLGGVVVCLGSGRWEAGSARRSFIMPILVAICGWALVSAFAAEQFEVALREWRVLFLNAVLFGFLLRAGIRRSCGEGGSSPSVHLNKVRVTADVPLLSTRREEGKGAPTEGRMRKGEERPTSSNAQQDLWLLISAWLAGGAVVALVGLWQYGSGIGTTEAEGVRRIQALYDSPNNLALYLERTLAVSAALALFLRDQRWRWLAAGIALLQGIALLLTFSKGAIFLGLPAMFATLWVGGLVILKQRGESRRTLWWLAAVAIVGLLVLTPFLGTERFQRLLDFSQGTGYLRIQLWRSAWQMALDHPLLGVGPDNFLYAFRSGYILPAAWQEPDLNHPHNFFLDWWTRLGIPGLVMGLTLFALGVRSIWRAIQSGGIAVLGVGLLAATVAALAHGLIDVSYALPDLMLVWVFVFGVAEMGGKTPKIV